jgi:hypothetical protein
MKKIISLLSALILAAGSCAAVSAKEVQKRPDGTVKLSVFDVVLEKKGDSTKVQLIGCNLAIVDTEPTREELVSHGTTTYWVDCEDPYLIYLDLDKFQIVKEDFDLNISYIVDLDENKVYDYETNEELGYYRDPNYKYETVDPGSGTITDPVRGTITIIPAIIGEIIGDINCDAVVDLTDLSELSLSLIGEKTLTANQLILADIDENGKVELSDLSRLKQFVSGKDITLGAK